MKKTFFLLVAMLIASVTAMAQNVSISGKVADANGEPLIGVSILVQGTTTGTMTDVDGNFTLAVPANAIIEVSSIGFVTQVIPIGNQTTFALNVFRAGIAADGQMQRQRAHAVKHVVCQAHENIFLVDMLHALHP